MPVDIRPRRLYGPWTDGFALDLHTLGSRVIGHNEYGHALFDTTRSPLGQLVYALKNQQDRSAVAAIAETAAEFVRIWNPPVDLLVPIPPSDLSRPLQPVILIAEAIAQRLNMALARDCVRKKTSTPQVKNIADAQQRTAILRGSFTVDAKISRDRSILLLDDLYRSGATANVAAKLLLEAGGARQVHLLTLTQTRKNR